MSRHPPHLLLLILSLWTLVLAGGNAHPNLHAAHSCLSAVSDLSILTPASDGYVVAARPFNLRISTDPGFVVFPTSVAQVQHIVSCAARAGLSVSAKSGGHSYAAYGLAGDVVVDLRNFKGLTLRKDGTVVVQTGNRLGEVATGIFAQGERALPHGSCPYVGIGGHTLYGGFGWVGRIGGLLLDTAVAAEVVLANGSLVTASDTSHVDLFWALRGGGPSFGLVTAWTYQTFPAPPTTVNYRIDFGGNLSQTEAVAAYSAWQGFATNVPEALALAAVFTPAMRGKVGLSFAGNYYGTEAVFQEVIAPLMEKLPNTANLSASALGWIQGLAALAGDNGTISTALPDGHDTFFTKSLITTRPSSNASIASWIEYMATAGASSDTKWFSQVDLYGGAISAVPADATAFAHRDAFLVYQLYASSRNMEPPYPRDGITFVDGMLQALEPRPSGAYPNYIDPTLSGAEWRRQYFREHVGRLESVKRAVDPGDVFRFREGF